MKKGFLLLLFAAFLPAAVRGQTFVEKFVQIYNRAADQKIEWMKVPQKELLDSLRLREASATGEELAQIRKQMEMVDCFKEVQMAGGFDLTSLSERDKQEMDRLIADHDELLRISRGATGGRLLAKYKRKKITEMVCWIEIGFSPFSVLPDFSGFSDLSDSVDMAPLLAMMNMKIEVIFDLPLVRGMTTEEFFARFVTDGDPDDPQAQQGLADDFMKLFDIRMVGSEEDGEVDEPFVLGKWLDEDTPAKEWKIKAVGEKYGLYDPSGKAILEPEYDGIERFTGFLRATPESYHMYILGFELTRDGKKGFADLAGKIIVPPLYDKVEHFERSNARYVRLYQNGKQGLANELTGEPVVPIEYDAITWRGEYLELKRGDIEERIGWDNDREQVAGTIQRAE